MAGTYLLSGRLPLLAPGDLSEWRQKELYQRMRTHQVPWADRHNSKGMTGNDKLMGPFNPLPYSQEGGTGFLDSVIQALQNGEPAKELTNKERLMIFNHGRYPAQCELLS